MSKVLHCKITKFIDDANEYGIQGEAEVLLSSFLKSLKLSDVIYLRKQYLAEEGIKIIAGQLGVPVLPVKGTGELLAQVMTRDVVMECSQGISTFGIRFKIGPPSDPCGCTLYYRPGPLPLLELRTLYFVERRSPSEWAEELLVSGSAQVVCTITEWLRSHKYYASGDYRYLLWKWDKLFRVPKIDENAINAGRAFRGLCVSLWKERKDRVFQTESTKEWPWFPKKLIKSFDRALLDEVGAEKLNDVLTAMGSGLDEWQRAA